MDRKEIRKAIYARIDELPTLPAVVPKLLQIMESPGANTDQVTGVISQDPALTSKILKVANSAYYGFPQGITGLDRAVSLLGFNMVKSLALSMGIIQGLPTEKTSPYFSWEGLWIHSLSVAILMKEMSRRFGWGDDRDHLFVVGLLHDTGKIVLNRFFETSFRDALDAASGDGLISLHEVEKRELGFDHGEVGGMLLRRWNLPPLIIEPIAAHHCSIIPESADVKDTAMLRIADVLPQTVGIGETGNPVPPELIESDMACLGIREKDLPELSDFLEEAGEGIHAFYSAMV